MPSIKRMGSDTISSSDAKKPAIAPTAAPATDLLQNAMGLTGTGAEQASGGASSDGQMEYCIERPMSHFGDRINTYRKSHKFMTFGLAPAVISPGTVSDADRWITSYLAEVPWHIPAFYLTPSEFNLLSKGAHCVELSVEVIYRGTTIQFETASTATGLATLNQINDIGIAHALNKTGWGSNVSFTGFNATEAMIPSGIAKPKYDAVTNYRGMTSDFYGTDNSDTNFANYIPHHQMGRHCFLYNYWAMSTRAATTATPTAAQNLYGGWPALSEKFKQCDGKTVVNTTVAKSTYHPKMGQLKEPLKHLGLGLPYPNIGANMRVQIQGQLVQPRVLSATRDAVGTLANEQKDGDRWILGEQKTNFSNDNTGGTPTVPTWNIYSPIEKSQVSRSGFWGEQDAHIQPSLHIGVQPVPALSTAALLADNASFNLWTDTRAYWEVVATMKVKEMNPTHLPYATVSNVPQGDVVMELLTTAMPDFNKNPADDGATFQGLYKYQGGNILPPI
uniref:Structural protein VP1 n=1 Tax=Phylloscopus inornatus ambidensovirus TaxID=2794452 RepID=A0A8E7G278_9VIRU|nr:MAG: structural protein VP1 [Phylloscopus inornatus ambidensovirus]